MAVVCAQGRGYARRGEEWRVLNVLGKKTLVEALSEGQSTCVYQVESVRRCH